MFVRAYRVWAGGFFFFFPESMTRHFLHPASAPDYGQNAQPCLAVLSGARLAECEWGPVVHVSAHV